MRDRYYEEVVRSWSHDQRRLFPPERFRYREETGSTNTDLLQYLRSGAGEPFDLVVADFQTAGRGRRGDRWEAPSGRNLLFSLALPLTGDRETWGRLPHLAAWAVGSAIESVLTSGERIATKWPNDILHRGRKLGGILVETVMEPAPFAVVGVGLNVNVRPHEFPDSIRELAVSLYELQECESSRWFLLGLVLEKFLHSYPDKLTKFEMVHDWLEERSFLKGKKLRIETSAGPLVGTARRMNANGELLLEDEEGTVHVIRSAERILFC